jgi:quinol-cytochrome oxidoreductase complex cytochrome b subunit
LKMKHYSSGWRWDNMAARFIAWLDERLGIISIWDTIFDRKIPKVNWWFTLGSASLFLFVMQGVTGIFLSVYYVPTPDHAYDSIQYIMNGVAFGWLIRGMHHWGATLMVIVVFAHMLRTFYYASYKFPRELTWLSGVLLLLATLGMGFTGYLLPMNQRAYWATTVGTEIAGSAPLIGPFIMRVLRGGSDLSAVTLARFFSVHIWFIPLLLALVIGLHMFLVIRLGISAIPDEED